MSSDEIVKHITLSETERNVVVINKMVIGPDVARTISDNINAMKPGNVIVVYANGTDCIKIHKLPEKIEEITYE